MLNQINFEKKSVSLQQDQAMDKKMDDSRATEEDEREQYTGFPSPAQDHTSPPIDLNKELIDHPSTTFFARIEGDALQDVGIRSGDIVVIDRSLEFQENDLVVCYIYGAFDIKYIHYNAENIQLVSSDPDGPKYDVTSSDDVLLWGVITYVIHKPNARR